MRRALERERRFEGPLDKFSRILWPWRESMLARFIMFMALLDYLSTIVALKLTHDNRVVEAGPMAKWALNLGGLPELFVVDAVVICMLLLLATGAQSLYSRLGFKGFGRAAFVLLILPYAVIILAVVYNNILVTFLGQ